MPLTVTNIGKNGRFAVINEAKTIIGYGRARASKTEPGMVTLFFPEHVITHIVNGVRVPINWLKEDIN